MIVIYGASDDLVQVEGCPGADEFNVYGDGPVMWRGDLIAPGGDAMRVHVLLADGCWHIAIGQADESIPLPSWPFRIVNTPDCGYSVVALITAPDGTRLDNVRTNGDRF
ncbi:hypothetical protein ACFHW2_11520 [Actinomadura sp. LOL_016]|uniref:hypothetical protein n=1 Tax=unclassified Actinomadura TaxID=2626254 RepID=UPI003A801FE7